jgi:hypothetical protein
VTYHISFSNRGQSTGVGPGPQQLWPGGQTSSALLVGLWPAAGTYPQTFNFYRATGANQPFSAASPIKSGVVPVPLTSTLSTPQIFVFDNNSGVGLPNSQSYTYYATQVVNGQESQPSHGLVMTTLGGPLSVSNPSTLPAAPMPWTPPPYSLPTGGTTWPCSTAAEFQTALSSASLGDVIVLTAGNTFTPTTNGWQFQQFPGTAGNYIYVTTSNYSSLPPLPVFSGMIWPTAITLPSAPAANATSATLSSPWSGKSGSYPTLFNEGAPVYEMRNVTYVNGSSTITWNGGLLLAAAATIYTMVLPGVTPYDLPNMPTLNFAASTGGNGAQFAAGLQYVRFVGINIQPEPNLTAGDLFSCIVFALTPPPNQRTPPNGPPTTPAQNIAFDRCIMGNDSTLPNFSWVRHGMEVNCNYFYMDGCYLWGFYGGGGPDANCLNVYGGQFGIVRNCYQEAASESFITGGGFVDQTQIPQDWQVYGNVSAKPLTWAGQPQAITFATAPTGTTGTLASPWTGLSSSASPYQYTLYYPGLAFGSGQAYSNCTVTNGSTAISWGSNAPSGAGTSAFVLINPIGNEVKNHHEMKVGQRFSFHDNFYLWNWAGSAGGQQGRMLVPDCRDQQSAPIFSSTFTGSISGNTLTTTSSQSFDAPYGQQLVGANVAYGTTITGGSGTSWTVEPAQTVASESMYACVHYLNTCPWNLVADVSAYNLVGIGGGSLGYVFTDDYCATGYTARVQFENILGWISPPGPGGTAPTATDAFGFSMAGPVADITFDHITVIFNGTQNVNTNNVSNPSNLGAINMYAAGPNLNVAPYGDRITVTNCVLNGQHGYTYFNLGGTFITTSGSAALAATLTNTLWTNNVTVSDGASFAASGTNYRLSTSGDYALLGMANFPGNTVAPLTQGQMDITSGTYATASTTGGPLGATF